MDAGGGSPASGAIATTEIIIREIAASVGYVERSTGRSDVLTFVKLGDWTASSSSSPSSDRRSAFPVAVEMFLETGDLCTYVPHPRQKVYRLFHFGALHSAETLRNVLQTPWSDMLFSYRFSDLLSHDAQDITRVLPTGSFEMALERQIAVIDREISDLKFERNEISRRLRQLPNTAPTTFTGERTTTPAGGGSHSHKIPANRRRGAALPPGSAAASASSSSSDHIMTNIDSFGGQAAPLPEQMGDADDEDEDGLRRNSVLRSSVCSYEDGHSRTNARMKWTDGSGRLVNRGDSNRTPAAASVSRGTPLVRGDMNFDKLRRVDSSSDRLRGNQALWSLHIPSNGCDAQSEFEMAYSAKPANAVMLGRGFVVLYDDGSIYWHGICPLLESKIRQQGLVQAAITRQSHQINDNPNTANTTTDPSVSPYFRAATNEYDGPSPSQLTKPARVKYIVLGSESNFYVKFDNGRMEWCGQDSLGSALRRGVNEKRLAVHRVAFGEDGSWLIIWNDGSFEAERMPVTLLERLKYRQYTVPANKSVQSVYEALSETSGKMSHIKDVTVGPNGEWFIIFKDHSVQADNLPDSLYKALSEIRERSGRVRAITFGENRSWFVRYWDPPIIQR